MAKITTARLSDHVDDDDLLRVATLVGGAHRGQVPDFVSGPEEIGVDEPELELFMDWDVLRGDGRGTYAQDDTECRSRRVDLRGPTDADPGPLPMEEAPDDVSGHHHLRLS